MPGLNKDSAERFLAQQSGFRRSFRKVIYLNCWYVSPVESAAMGAFMRRLQRQSRYKAISPICSTAYRRVITLVCRLQARGTKNKRQLVFSVSVQAQIVRARTRTKSCSLAAARRGSEFFRKRHLDRNVDLREFEPIDRTHLRLAQQSSMVSRVGSGRFEKVWVERQRPAVRS